MSRVCAHVSAEEARQVEAAVDRALANQTMLWAEPFHCAVGTTSHAAV